MTAPRAPESRTPAVPVDGLEQAVDAGSDGLLEESESRFRVMADCAPVMLWMADRDSKRNFFNQGWLAFRGRTLEQEMGDGWAEGVHPADFQGCVDGYMEAFRERRPFRIEYRLRRADGQYRWILDQGAPRYAPDGAFLGCIGSCIDISDFKEAQATLRQVNLDLERRVEERTSALKRSNEDLEQFAYVASHDLQEPLAMVSSYVQLLERRYKGKLGADADDFIRYTIDGASRMQHLIHDLLTFSRASSRPQKLAPTDAGGALDMALRNLEKAVADSGAEVTRDPMPTVAADVTQMAEVFQNLLSNAIKFRGEAPPRIHVGACRDGDRWVFSVRDDGIGIEPEYIGRLFRMFERLHPQDRFPGSGIGLAICKKIVQRHGGTVWVESKGPGGSTFFFTLPAAGRL